MKNLVKNFQNFSHEHSLWKKGDRIILGVSGGPDSMCLLDIFQNLRKKYSLELVVAHVNYNLRGKDSQKDEALVRKVARENGIEAIIHSPKKKASANKEAAWRKMRYDFFEKVRQERGFNLIAVAHNADDQVETFFLNLFRGAGIDGLSGMRPKNGNIIRPLLFSSKKDILEYAKENRVEFGIDMTNQENLFIRNKIRNILIPQIEKQFNPNIKNTVWRTMEILSEERSACQTENLRDLTASQVREIIKTLRSPKNKSQKLSFGDLKVERRGDKLTIEKINK